MATVTHACGHKARIDLYGRAATKSATLHSAARRDCRKCEAQARQDRAATPEGREEATMEVLRAAAECYAHDGDSGDCMFCDHHWTMSDSEPEHEPDCPVMLARRVLEGIASSI